ncbi:MAG: single-stranded-DNA-specific exonuclease RecJ [Myxococcales bacterium]|nr:single-stranded-DNA-specific exonuclease RecJ [Myxococcales bacterium]
MPPERAWVLHEPDPHAVAALTAAGHSPLLARLLALRGLRTPAAATAFLQPDLRSLPDPSTMADIDIAAARVADAVERGEKVCIYGDYDVDGITAAALLHGLCEAIGFAVEVFLPDRFRDGYGLHADRLQELCDRGVTLVISVDCGTTAVAEIAAVRARGVDFIVCDHHQLGAVRPNATALLNPQRPECGYPDKDLSAVGIALVLCQAVRRALDRRGWRRAGDGISAQRLELKGLVELAALGTIADVARLHGVNRVLCWHGLRNLGSTARPGVRALIEASGPEGVGADRVGFQLAPRLNAVGRLQNPMDAFRLLTTKDAAEGKRLAELLDVENNRRREIEARDVATALELALAQDGCADAVVVFDASMHQGVVGIVAARLREKVNAPAFALTLGEDGLAKGSGRSVDGYDLVAGLHACEALGPLFERYGGHAHAAGVTLRPDRIETFRVRLQAHVLRTLPAHKRVREVRLDAEVLVAEANFDLLTPLEALEPHGRGNAKPVLLLRDGELRDLRVVGKTREWVQAKLFAPGRQELWARPCLELFGALAAFEGLQGRGERVDVAVRLDRNAHNGKVRVQGKVEAVRRSGGGVEVRSGGGVDVRSGGGVEPLPGA